MMARSVYPLYLTALLTGMRLGELLGLRWEDVDLGGGTLRVQQTLYRLNGSKKDARKPQLLLKRPKSRASQRFHDLRHCHASHLARAGVPVKVAQERLGHSTPALTLRIYTHTLAGQHEEAARAVENLVLNGSLLGSPRSQA